MESEDLLKELPTPPEERASFDPAKEMDLCRQKSIDFLLFTDSDYPASLKEIPDPPLLLYKKGSLIENDRNAIAIVGTRHPSFYGRTQAKRFSQELAAKGITIVSGLARGIDQIAHDGALQISYGRTIAVLGCGLDIIYPREHEDLYRRITERGAVLSEYPLGTPPLPENFPRRNRILSGLSYATFVVEAHSRSGSLITAHQAAEQGREVFALPGPVDQLTSRGTHQLIKEGACLVETPEDILLALADRLRLENKVEPVPSGASDFVRPEACFLISSGKEEIALPVEGGCAIEELLKEEGPLAQEEILEFTGLESSKLPSLLLKLELEKKIRRDRDGRYALPC
jgi:DNA processing protein